MKPKTKREIIFLFLRKKCSVEVTFKSFFFFSFQGRVWDLQGVHETQSILKDIWGHACPHVLLHASFFFFSPYSVSELCYELGEKHGSYEVFCLQQSSQPTQYGSHIKKYDTEYWATIDIGQSTIRSIIRVLLIPHYLLSKHSSLEIRNRGNVCVCVHTHMLVV